MGGQKPFVERNLRAFKHSAHCYSILLTAVIALNNTLADHAFRVRLGLATLLGRQALGVK